VIISDDIDRLYRFDEATISKPKKSMNIQPKVKPILDEGFVPAVLWNAEYRKLVAADAGAHDVKIALTRLDGTVFRKDVQVLTHEGENVVLNVKYVERLVKFMLWGMGGCTVIIAGNDDIAAALGEMYSENGSRSFDWDIVGKGMFSQNIEVKAMALTDVPAQNSPS